MNVYIAGKMAGLPDLGREKFAEAEKMLKEQGFSVLNPAVLPDTLPREKYMPICLAMVDAADAVYALDNWQDSRGAALEIQYARYQGKDIIWRKERADI